MKIVVTGGAGYVGGPVVEELLNAGHHVRVVDTVAREGTPYAQPRAAIEYVQGDLRDTALVARAVHGADAVVHLAALVIVRKLKDDAEAALLRAINVEATRSLVEAAKAAGVKRFVFSSTCSNYEPTEPARPATEETPLKATNAYTEGKIEAEQLVLASRAPGFEPVVVRLATVYGASHRLNFEPLPNSWLREAIEKGKLEVYGPKSWRPYVHTRDVARALRLVVEAPAAKVDGEIFNVGSEAQNAQKETIAALLQKLLPTLEVTVNPAAVDPRNYYVTCAKIERVLGFRAQESLESGLAELERIVRASHGVRA